MPTELDEFRPRIRNWSRVYRDRFTRHESNLMMVIRNAKIADGETMAPPSSADPNVRDADILDGYIRRLRIKNDEFERLFPVFREEYLTRYSVEDFETKADEEFSVRRRAKRAGVFARDYRSKLIMSETMLMLFSKKIENPLAYNENIQYDVGNKTKTAND